ncbi:hypothetical protein GN956_G3532 [Arapaima gigas]
MARNLKGLFDVGEDLDEDLLQTDWDVPAEPTLAAAGPIVEATCLRAPAQPPASHPPHVGPALKASSCTSLKTGSGSHTLSAVGGVSDALGLRCVSDSAVFSAHPHTFPVSLRPELVDQTERPAPLPNIPIAPDSHCKVDPSPDDFDDWDLDLEELDENALQGGPLIDHSTPAPASKDASPAKRMRGSLCSAQAVPAANLQCSGLRTASALSFSVPSPCPRLAVTTPSMRPLRPVAPVGPGTLRTVRPPLVCRAATSGFQSVGGHQSSAHMLRPSGSGSSAPTPSPLRTPVFTNHLVQLVSAANKTPQKPRMPPAVPKTRRFPGPAGLLPQQLNGQSLDDIVVPHPQSPAHGAMARLHNQIPSSQGGDEEFSRGPWAAMKAEMGLDERNPTCFLHSYSVVMVLRKAALKQLAKNKVPNMAVMLKRLLHTHADAKAVFQDPTGEMQGTVHRRLLEDRQGELKVGAVLLLKQVGVFSPSHRNHYLNVTPSNLLRIYLPGGATWCSAQQVISHVTEQQTTGNAQSSPAAGGLMCDSERGERRASGHDPEAEAWDADDLDQLLGELPEESCIL